MASEMKGPWTYAAIVRSINRTDPSIETRINAKYSYTQYVNHIEVVD